MVDFLLPESDKDNGENPIVDSLAVVSEWTIVAKCALHGLIYMWDLKVSLQLREQLKEYQFTSTCYNSKSHRDETGNL